MVEKVDWYTNTQAEERWMYGNIEEKIDGYKGKYPFLTTDLLENIHAACRTFIEAYGKIQNNRSTGQ